MRSRASVKPSDYPALPFHGIRFVSFLSSSVVTIILAIFIYHLHADGYRLPFAFLVVRPQPITPITTTTTNNPSSTPAPSYIPSLPPHNPPHQPLKLLLRPLPQILPRPQHPPPPPLAPLPRPPRLQHVRHNPHQMHNDVLGHLHRPLRLPLVQGSLRIHRGRDCDLYRGDLVGCRG